MVFKMFNELPGVRMVKYVIVTYIIHETILILKSLKRNFRILKNQDLT